MSGTPIRVLHAANSLGLGGTEKVMQLFVAHLDTTLFTPVVYSPKDGERAAPIRALGVDTYIGADFLGVLKKVRPHIVHIHRAGWPEPGLLKPVKLAAIPAVVETNVFGRHDPSPLGTTIDRTLFVSRFCLDRFLKAHGNEVSVDRYGFLYNPVDTDTLAAHRPENRDCAAPIAGRISRPDPGKWSRLALDFLPLVIREIPDFEYRVIGAIPEAVRFVTDHGLERNVMFLDPVRSDREIAEFMRPLSLLAHANDTGESFGLVIAEAMACGLPVITHPSEGLRDNAQLELVEHGKTGLVATSTEEYARAVLHLLAHPEKARRMGEAGRTKAHTLFRAQAVTKTLQTIYLDLLASKGITP